MFDRISFAIKVTLYMRNEDETSTLLTEVKLHHIVARSCQCEKQSSAENADGSCESTTDRRTLLVAIK
jgi:hypothetical protein